MFTSEKTMTEYVSAQNVSNMWGITKRRVQYLCEQNRIPGAVRIGNMWAIPSNAEKPKDARVHRDIAAERVRDKRPTGTGTRKARKNLRTVVEKTMKELSDKGLSASDSLYTLIVSFASELLFRFIPMGDICFDVCESFFCFHVNEFLSEESLSHIKKFISDNETCLDDSLSWVYQFATKKSDVFQYCDTQFFTEKYMVKTLVDSLPINQSSNVADPACGGGNFLLYAMEKLLNYEVGNISKKTIDHVLENLQGYEIDRFLSYVAAFNLKLKALEILSNNKAVSIDDFLSFHTAIFYPVCETTSGFLDVDWSNQIVENCETKKPFPLSMVFKNTTIVVTNPPFQTIKGMPISLRNYLQQYYPDSKCDLCNAFIERVLSILPEEGKAALVTQNSWMYLESYNSLRRRILLEYSIDKIWELGANAFYDLSGEKANVVLVSFTKKKPHETHEIALWQLRHMAIEEIAKELENNPIPPLMVKQIDIKKRPASRFDLVSTVHLQSIQRKCDQYKKYAIPMQGTSTGDAKSLIDYYWRHIDEKDWILVSKGGGYSRFEGLNSYCVKWGENGEYIKNTKGSAIRNANYFSDTQLVFSDTGTAGLNVRVLLPGQIFVASGPGIRIVKGKKFAHLAFLNSRFAAFFVRLLSPKMTIAAGYIGQIPVTEKLLNSELLEQMARQCLNAKAHRLTKRPNCFEFAYVKHDPEVSITEMAHKWFIEDLDDEWIQLMGEEKIEREIIREFALNTKDIEAIEAFVGKRMVFADSSTAVESQLYEHDLCKILGHDCFPKRTKASKKSLGADGIIEYLALMKEMPCETIYNVLRDNFDWVSEQYIDLYLHALVLSASRIHGNVLDSFNCDDLVSKMGIFDVREVDQTYRWLEERFDVVHNSVFSGKPIYVYNHNKHSLSKIGV